MPTPSHSSKSAGFWWRAAASAAPFGLCITNKKEEEEGGREGGKTIEHSHRPPNPIPTLTAILVTLFVASNPPFSPSATVTPNRALLASDELDWDAHLETNLLPIARQDNEAARATDGDDAQNSGGAL